MRTLVEIEKYLRGRLADHETQKAAIAQNIADLEKAVAEDDAAMKAAASSGDQTAYHESISSKSFHEAQLEQLRSTVILPALNKEEIKAMTKEIQDQSARERYNAYVEILKLRKKCRQLLEQRRKAVSTFDILNRLLAKGGNLRFGPLGADGIGPHVANVIDYSQADSSLEAEVVRIGKKFNLPQP